MMTIDQFQVTDAIPLDDGSISTTLVDASGTPVATVTRFQDGTAEAALETNASSGFDWTSIFGKVTDFLDNAAKIAGDVSREAQKISNAAKGGAAGARVGYNGPTDWTPYLIGGGVLIAALMLSQRRSSKRRS